MNPRYQISRDDVLNDAVMLDANGQPVAGGPWLVEAFEKMAGQSAYAAPRKHVNEVVVAATYPKASAYKSSMEMARAAQTAVQGSATKQILTYVYPDAASLLLDQQVNLTVPSFGVQVTIGGSELAFVRGVYQVTLGEGATPLASFYCYAQTPGAKFILLGISNNGGTALITRVAAPRVTVIAAGSNNFIGQAIIAETLNARDLSVFGL